MVYVTIKFLSDTRMHGYGNGCLKYAKVCPSVRIEPELQPLTGESLSYTSANRQDSARLDIHAQGFWGEWRHNTFFDVRVFNPHASSNRQSSLESSYWKHEKEKKRAYDQRV